MNLRLCVLLLLGVLLVTDMAEGKRHKGKRRHKKVLTTTTTTEAPMEDTAEDTAEDTEEDAEEDEMDFLMDDEAAAAEARGEAAAREAEIEAIVERLTRSHARPDRDACRKKRCGVGRQCTLTEAGEATCTCVPECDPETDVRRQVCTNHNQTWNSDCAVYRQRCLCVDGVDGCLDSRNEHLHIDYYGQCRDVGECSEEEMADFPRRMREWLFNVMKDMAERKKLGPLYSEMEEEAETDENKRWLNAAIWRWCELDNHPADSAVSRHELFPIRATLLAMEHCISPFLDSCDVDADHDISLAEWAACLDVTDGEIKERCERIKQEDK